MGMTRLPLSMKALTELTPRIKRELGELLSSAETTPAAALDVVFSRVFGPERSRKERRQFLIWASPFARNLAFARENPDRAIPNEASAVYVRRLAREGVNLVMPVPPRATMRDLLAYLRWLQGTDPCAVAALDLHYFAGLSIRETAETLQTPVAVVIEQFRSIRAALRVPPPSAIAG